MPEFSTHLTFINDPGHGWLKVPLAEIAVLGVTVKVDEELSAEQALEVAFRQTQHLDDSWWNNRDVRLHVRSTSMGDVLAVSTGGSHNEVDALFVVERMGFRPYQPVAIRPYHRLSKPTGCLRRRWHNRVAARLSLCLARCEMPSCMS